MISGWKAGLIGACVVLARCGPLAAQGQDAEPPLVPSNVETSEALSGALNAAWLTDEERKDLRVFHGLWDDSDLDSPERKAKAALAEWRLDAKTLSDSGVSSEIRAEALMRQGEVVKAIELLDSASSFRASRIRAEALEVLGRYDDADAAIDRPVSQLMTQRVEDAGPLVEGVRSLIIRSRLRGQPARDYGTMMGLLARARQELDRLYWPAHLTEASLLLEKDNTAEAVSALHETLALNPRCSEAWYMLGRVAVETFDFESARRAARALQRMNAHHPLAYLLLARSAMVENDPDRALDYLHRILNRYPSMREARAVECAAIALQYDKSRLQGALAQFDELSPGSALAYYEAGTALSLDRQYELAADLLNEAVRRQPKWTAPQIELGLLEMQSGRDALALAALQRVRTLDQFNTRVANSLHLLEQLANRFTELETPHFVIRYDPESQDQVVADLMASRLEDIHNTVSTRFEHSPDRKTVVELMPDHQWFAVRITGMPSIHTIAACTGPVLAMEVPREGPPNLHFGTYDWPRVFQHEYTHTVTLSQTRNRIPHWLTEAAAVSMEPGPRDYRRVQMLVDAYRANRLFTLDEINWAFIRPKRAGDRSLAYAQGFWMVEFMNERFGESALVRLMQHYFDGEREDVAIPRTLNISRQDFYDAFIEWAGEQVNSWGFGFTPSLDSLLDSLRIADADMQEQMEQNRSIVLQAIARLLTQRVGEATEEREESFGRNRWPQAPKPEVEVSDEQLARWLAQYPDHPDLLEMAINRAMAMNDEVPIELVPILEKYADVRPVDPMPHRLLALFWQNRGESTRAIPHLEYLDVREEYDEVYAAALANIYRSIGEKEKALAKAMRAVNINPYRAPHRELAAALAIEAGDLALARANIVALTILEPDRRQHQRRLEAIDRLLASQTG